MATQDGADAGDGARTGPSHDPGATLPMAHAPWYAAGRLPLDPDLDGPDEVVATKPRRGHTDVVAVVAAGGALGGLARYGLNEALPGAGAGFPWATFVENVCGCALLGALMVYLLEVRGPSRYLRPFLGVGVLGGFTTFSAYTSELRGLLMAGRVATALAYLWVSLLAGLLATVAGIALARGVFEATEVEEPA